MVEAHVVAGAEHQTTVDLGSDVGVFAFVPSSCGQRAKHLAALNRLVTDKVSWTIRALRCINFLQLPAMMATWDFDVRCVGFLVKFLKRRWRGASWAIESSGEHGTAEIECAMAVRDLTLVRLRPFFLLNNFFDMC